MPQTHYQEWKRLLEILPSTSVGAALRNRAEALEQAKRKLQAQFEDIRDAWVAGGETTQREIRRGWVERIDNEAAWETEERGEKSELWKEFMYNLYPAY